MLNLKAPCPVGQKPDGRGKCKTIFVENKCPRGQKQDKHGKCQCPSPNQRKDRHGNCKTKVKSKRGRN